MTARHAKYKAPHYMTYMTYMTYYKQLAFAAISPLTFLCDSSRLVAAASYIEADVSAWRLDAAASYIEADVSVWQLVTAASYIEGDVSPDVSAVSAVSPKSSFKAAAAA